MSRSTRRFEAPYFTSSALPALRMRVAPSLAYVGELSFDMFDLVHVERHIFAEAADSKIERMLILQFEGFLPGIEDEYRWPTHNPFQLGNQTYQFGNYLFSQSGEIAKSPTAETAHTKAWLAEHGFTIDDELMMARFARIVDDAKRHEFIIFYMEGVARTGHTMAHLSIDGELKPSFAHLGAELTARAHQHFHIEE